jgi:hypothetical protein
MMLLALITACVSMAKAADLYVSPNGSDRNAGTMRRPFASVDRARVAARRLIERSREPIVVHLAPGYYRLTRPLRFEPKDSGRPGRPVIYRSTGAVLCGSVRVEGWKPASGGLWSARLAGKRFRQLWVNGRRAQRARGPIPAGLTPCGEQKGVITPFTPGGTVGRLAVTGDAGYTTQETRLLDWPNPDDMEFGYTNSWTHVICPIASVVPDPAGARILMRQPCFYFATHKGGVQIGTPDYIENALALLNEPGQWYYDRRAGMLYYMPVPGEGMSRVDVEAPLLETLLELRGTPERPVHDIVFDGIRFEYATWLRPSTEGHADVQANFVDPSVNVYWIPEQKGCVDPVNGEMLRSQANVQVTGGSRVTFVRCTFAHLGSAGLDLQAGTSDCAVRRCRFTDISGSGIQIGDVTRDDHHPADPRRAVRDNSVEDCTIERIGAEFQDSIGIFCGYTLRSRLLHNEIHDLPYTGVSVGWGWGMPDAGGGAYISSVIYQTPASSGGNVIEGNHIHHVMLKRNDGGGIYTLSRQPGTVIKSNYIHDNGPGSPGGIYLDEGSADIEVTGNVVTGVANPMNFNNNAQNRKATCRVHDNTFGAISSAGGGPSPEPEAVMRQAGPRPAAQTH